MRGARAALILTVLAACDQPLPNAGRITLDNAARVLLSGAVADGAVGDFYLRNDEVTAIIQRPGRVFSVGPYGGNLIDFGRNETAHFVDLAGELVELVRPDAAFFGCEKELDHVMTIAEQGTSAEKQLALAGEATDDGLVPQERLDAIVDHLLEETQSGH